MTWFLLFIQTGGLNMLILYGIVTIGVTTIGLLVNKFNQLPQ